MKNYIEKVSETKNLIILFAGFAIFLVLSNTVFSQDFAYLTQTFNYSNEQAYDLMNSIGDTGRRSHLLILISDLVMVFLYTNFLLGINYRLSCSITKKCKVITAITFFPLVLAIVQLSEIVGIAILVFSYKNEFETLANLTNYLTMIKFTLTAICFGLPIVLLCVNILLKLTTKRKMKVERQ